ncbi:MAG TPA: hypothetical protein PKI96_16035 [Sedimentisphaerales bacterium]|nr:hypothetical protein [Sedimentisphaerales bacterium]HQA89916.1 hypothetical protein [Sedimentisphaerales bacterium]
MRAPRSGDSSFVHSVMRSAPVRTTVSPSAARIVIGSGCVPLLSMRTASR